MEAGPYWLRIGEASRYLRIAESTFRKYMQSGIIPPAGKVIGKVRLWSRPELDLCAANPHRHAGKPVEDVLSAYEREAQERREDRQPG